VIAWNFLLPAPVNCMRTSGCPFVSRSARVPESFKSAPVSSGMVFLLYLKRYHVVLAGGDALTPGQTTAVEPHEMTTVSFGVPKTTYVSFFFGVAAATERALMPRFFAGFVLKSASRDAAGPAISFFVVLSKMYHSLAPFSLTSDCWPASSA